jgi:hypothetical protein
VQSRSLFCESSIFAENFGKFFYQENVWRVRRERTRIRGESNVTAKEESKTFAFFLPLPFYAQYFRKAAQRVIKRNAALLASRGEKLRCGLRNVQSFKKLREKNQRKKRKLQRIIDPRSFPVKI